MRNVVLADRIAAARGLSWAVIAAYAEADGLPTAEKVRSGPLGHAPASGAKLVVPFSYQAIVALARSVRRVFAEAARATDRDARLGRIDHPNPWDDLAEWVSHKVAKAKRAQRQALSSEVSGECM
jgi:hypothetical protein